MREEAPSLSLSTMSFVAPPAPLPPPHCRAFSPSQVFRPPHPRPGVSLARLNGLNAQPGLGSCAEEEPKSSAHGAAGPPPPPPRAFSRSLSLPKTKTSLRELLGAFGLCCCGRESCGRESWNRGPRTPTHAHQLRDMRFQSSVRIVVSH